jgi:hypothetical protein
MVKVSPASSEIELPASLGATATLKVGVPATVEVVMVLIPVWPWVGSIAKQNTENATSLFSSLGNGIKCLSENNMAL